MTEIMPHTKVDFAIETEQDVEGDNAVLRFFITGEDQVTEVADYGYYGMAINTYTLAEAGAYTDEQLRAGTVVKSKPTDRWLQMVEQTKLAPLTDEEYRNVFCAVMEDQWGHVDSVSARLSLPQVREIFDFRFGTSPVWYRLGRFYNPFADCDGPDAAAAKYGAPIQHPDFH